MYYIISAFLAVYYNNKLFYSYVPVHVAKELVNVYIAIRKNFLDNGNQKPLSFLP